MEQKKKGKKHMGLFNALFGGGKNNDDQPENVRRSDESFDEFVERSKRQSDQAYSKRLKDSGKDPIHYIDPETVRDGRHPHIQRKYDEMKDKWKDDNNAKRGAIPPQNPEKPKKTRTRTVGKMMPDPNSPTGYSLQMIEEEY